MVSVPASRPANRLIAGEEKRLQRALARTGLWLRDHQRAIRAIQWVIIGAYAGLLIIPLMTPMPDRLSHIWSNAVLFAQFMFWGIWWPFVLVSMVLMGRMVRRILPGRRSGGSCQPPRLWSRHTRAGSNGKAGPSSLCLHHDLWADGERLPISKPVIIVLGGSTLAAMAVGFLYGRESASGAAISARLVVCLPCWPSLLPYITGWIARRGTVGSANRALTDAACQFARRWCRSRP